MYLDLKRQIVGLRGRTVEQVKGCDHQQILALNHVPLLLDEYSTSQVGMARLQHQFLQLELTDPRTTLMLGCHLKEQVSSQLEQQPCSLNSKLPKELQHQSPTTSPPSTHTPNPHPSAKLQESTTKHLNP
jgi:hypothetical protein